MDRLVELFFLSFFETHATNVRSFEHVFCSNWMRRTTDEPTYEPTPARAESAEGTMNHRCPAPGTTRRRFPHMFVLGRHRVLYCSLLDTEPWQVSKLYSGTTHSIMLPNYDTYCVYIRLVRSFHVFLGFY
jgi:hypothetical protein